MRHAAAFNEGGEGDVTGLVREVHGRVGVLADLLRDLGEQVAEGTDATGAVVARVSGAGRLLGLAVDPRAMRDLDHVAMSAAIRNAIGAARGAMGERLAEAMAEFAGSPPPDDPLAPYVRALLRED